MITTTDSMMQISCGSCGHSADYEEFCHTHPSIRSLYGKSDSLLQNAWAIIRIPYVNHRHRGPVFPRQRKQDSKKNKQ